VIQTYCQKLLKKARITSYNIGGYIFPIGSKVLLGPSIASDGAEAPVVRAVATGPWCKADQCQIEPLVAEHRT